MRIFLAPCTRAAFGQHLISALRYFHDKVGLEKVVLLDRRDALVSAAHWCDQTKIECSVYHVRATGLSSEHATESIFSHGQPNLTIAINPRAVAERLIAQSLQRSVPVLRGHWGNKGKLTWLLLQPATADPIAPAGL